VTQKFLFNTALVVFAGAVLTGCAMLPTTRSEQVAAEETPTPIPTAQIALKPVYEVQVGDVIKSTEFSGRISPVLEEELYFQVDGRIRAVYFTRNAQLKKGDVIAELEIDALERELVASKLELERAQVLLTEAERALELDQKAAQLRLEMAQILYDSLEGSSQSTRGEVAAQAKAVELAALEVERLAAGISPLLLNDVTRAQFAVEKLQQEIAEAQIIAPFDGILLSVSLTPGKNVTAYQPVAKLADDSQLEISTELLSDQLELLSEQMTVTLALGTRPGETMHGVIRRLPYPYGSGGSGKTIEESDKTTRVTILEPAEEAGYALGDLVRVTAEIEHERDVLWLPPQAIRSFNGRRFAVVQDGDVQRRVDVTLGVEAEERVEIEAGLEAGQIVVAP
jgi:multidrug efflux pump subunit AcrA (membrane-fusion protein)